MRGEIDTYSRELRWIFDQIGVSLRGLTPAQLNWRPPTSAANSAYAIVTHVIGSTGVYVLGFGCGLPVPRDRSAEFAASGDDADTLVARVSQLSAKIETSLAALPPAALDELITPPKELWGTGNLVGSRAATRSSRVSATPGFTSASCGSRATSRSRPRECDASVPRGRGGRDMTYGYRPENWPVFQAELRKRRIAATDIEKVEMRPESTDPDPAVTEHPRNMNVTVTLRSGRVESWRQPQETTM